MAINYFLVIGAVLSAIAALLHIGIVFGGASWYRFFGAGENFAVAAQQGKWWPHIATFGIALVLFAWAAYALSGASLIDRLPLLQWALLAITATYLLRGFGALVVLIFRRQLITPFNVWSSVICAVFGLVHAIGFWQAWPAIK